MAHERVLRLRDPLAELLGARAPGEPFEYRYEDAVRLSGHSCPTVAGAFLAVDAALQALYSSGEMPARGQIEVTLGGPPEDGTAGPMSQVISLITGAASHTGFGGLMGRHRRRGLLSFDPSLGGRIRFRRVDTGAAVDVTYTPAGVPPAPEMGPLLASVLAGGARDDERRRFAELWQARVQDLLSGDPGRVLNVRVA